MACRIDPERAHILVGLQVASRRERAELVARFEAAGLPTLDLSDNELAKLHIRHLAGGRAPGADGERLVRFAFPERPGALLQFLSRMGRTWNISLFHYRYHGADFGRVLCAFQVPAGDGPAFQAFLEALGYEYVDEGQNPAYRLFLA